MDLLQPIIGQDQHPLPQALAQRSAAARPSDGKLPGTTEEDSGTRRHRPHAPWAEMEKYPRPTVPRNAARAHNQEADCHASARARAMDVAVQVWESVPHQVSLFNPFTPKLKMYILPTIYREMYE